MSILLSYCFLLLLHGCVAQWEGQLQQEEHRPVRDETECRVQNLSALEPTSRIESEAGITEFWNQNDEQFQCAGVAAVRYVIQPKGLLLPSFSNAPKLVYIVQGSGIEGALIPGCPETFQSFPQGIMSRFGDQHQKIRPFRQGDIIAVPAGVAIWCYNDGKNPIVAVSVYDTSNDVNQLDRNLRKFFLAGKLRQQLQEQQQHEGEAEGPSPAGQGHHRRESSGNNILSGIGVDLLSEAVGVSRETARRLQSENDTRGSMVYVKDELQVIRPPIEKLVKEDQWEEGRGNGLEETLCRMRLKESIGDPEGADVYNPGGGLISSLNSQKLPILSYLKLSAERGILYRNATMAPHWNMNAHSVIYVTKGKGRVQIVGNYEQPVFDGEVREGQMVIVPQNFAVIKRAGRGGFEWVAFKTNDNAMTSSLAGGLSAIRGMPAGVVEASYRISTEEAMKVKFSREEITVLRPSFGSQGRASF